MAKLTTQRFSRSVEKSFVLLIWYDVNFGQHLPFQAGDLLGGPRGSVRRAHLEAFQANSSESVMKEAAVVDCLIELATDESVLALSYFGWRPEL